MAKCYAIGDYGFAQDYSQAIKYTRKSAMANNIHAIFMMFEMYRNGLFGITKDDQQAVYWVRKGARLGDAYCEYVYGMMLKLGIGCLKNEKEALSWLHKSADQKDIDAQCYLIGYYNSLSDKESKDKLLSLGLDFLINPNISQNTEAILVTKSIVGFELFNRKEYAKGIALVRESRQKTNDELVQFYWQMMNEYAREVLETTLDALENQ